MSITVLAIGDRSSLHLRRIGLMFVRLWGSVRSGSEGRREEARWEGLYLSLANEKTVDRRDVRMEVPIRGSTRDERRT